MTEWITQCCYSLSELLLVAWRPQFGYSFLDSYLTRHSRYLRSSSQVDRYKLPSSRACNIPRETRGNTGAASIALSLLFIFLFVPETCVCVSLGFIPAALDGSTYRPMFTLVMIFSSVVPQDGAVNVTRWIIVFLFIVAVFRVSTQSKNKRNNELCARGKVGSPPVYLFPFWLKTFRWTTSLGLGVVGEWFSSLIWDEGLRNTRGTGISSR